MLDEPTMSDQTLLLSVEDLINLAMGPIAGNTVDFKMLKTILHILARQMRLLEQKVVLEVGELPQPPMLQLRRDRDGSQTSSSDSKGRESAGSKKKRDFGSIPEERRDWSLYGDKGEESEGSVDSYEMEERREEAQRARDKDIEKFVKAEREKERAKAERAKMENMDPAEREEYQNQLQKEQEQREMAEKFAEEEEQRAEQEARAQREIARAEREKLKAEKSRLRLEKENEMAEKEREIAERESAKMGEMSPSEKKEYQKQLDKEKEERIKALRMAQDEEERVEKEKAKAERDKARAEKEKERAERERAKMENMSPREKDSYQQELEKVKAEREEESRKLEKMDSKERQQYEKAQHKERERVRFAKMTPTEKDIYEQEVQKKKDEKEKVKMENMTPGEREQYMEEKEKLAKLEKMSPKEKEKYEKQQQKEIAEKEKAKLEKMSPKEREKYEKQQQKEFAEKEKAKLEKMSPKEREKYEKQQQKEIAEKEQAKLEKMSPKEKEKYQKQQQKEKEKAEKEKAKIEKMSPKEREKYEKEQQKEKEKADKDSDKSEKEKAKLEKMSPKEREKYEKQQQKEKEKAEKERAKIDKMSPKERERYEMEQEKEISDKEKERLENMSPREREKYEKERQKERGRADRDSDKSEKEKAILEKMSPKEREKYEKEQAKAEKQAQKELEKEKAKMAKMSPEEREKYVQEKERAEREARDRTRAEDSGKLGDVVDTISEKYDTKLKEKVLVVEKGSSGRGSELRSRRSSIEVVTRSQFALLEAAVEALKDNTGPLPPLTLPDNDQLRTDLVKGNLSLTDAMMAMQVSARVQAAEQAIGRLGGVLTQLAGQGVVDEGALADDDEHGSRAPRADGSRTHGKGSPSMTSHKSVQLKEPGTDLASKPSRMSTATGMGMGMSRPSMISKGPASMALTQYEMDAALDALRKELMEKVNAITSRALTSAETTSNLAKSVVEKMDMATKIDDRISTLNALVADYTEQLAGFDAGLTTQMQSFREQITQMRGDLSAGLALLESANNNAETAAMMELTERYEELVNGLDNTLLAHQALAAFQDQLNLDFRSLLESVEMLREQKADRDEVIDGLRDKADNDRLAGLLRDEEFNEARVELDKELAVCHDKFRKQDAVWVAALKELTGVVQRKAEHTDLMKTRQETAQQLQEIDEKIKRLAFILGEPKAAILTRKMAKDALCAVCLVPALMDPEDATTGKPPRLPAAVAGRPLGQHAAPVVTEEPCMPEWKPPEAPDLRTHTCLRWVGGSHTLLSAAKRGHCEQPVAPPTTAHKFLGQGDDGKMYMMESELQPCEECNQPVPCSEGGPCDYAD